MRKLLFFFIFFMLSGSVHAEKDRLAVMDVTDEDGIFDEKTLNNVTDYIFTKFQGTGLFWMIPKSDRDTALDKAIEETKLSSRKECVDEKCQLSLVAELQANFLINTKIKKLYENTCQISISKFDVEKRAGVFSWEEKFNCTGKAVFEAIDGMNLSGIFKEGKIGETIEDWEVGTGEETIVKFESDPAEAVVLVDGRIVCQKTPCSKQLTTGKHEIVIQKENYLPKSKIFDIKKGLSVKEELEPDFGWLNITGKYTVELKLDGEIIGNIPIEKKIINPGAHEIEHTNSCYYQSGEKFTIKRGETKNITLDLKPKESAIKVNARDDKGNDIEADVFVDGNKVGTAPGTFKIPMCSKDLIVMKEKLQFKKTLSLEEKKVSEIDAVLKTINDTVLNTTNRSSDSEQSFTNLIQSNIVKIDNKSMEKRDKAIKGLNELIKDYPESPRKAEIYRRLAELYWEKARGIKTEIINAGQTEFKASWGWNNKAIDVCDYIIKKYPDFQNIDEVYFFMASNLMEVGQPMRALRYYTLVVEKYTNSKFVTDAFFEKGEYFFNNKNFLKAIPNYKAILDKYPTNKFYGVALIRYAECLYNLGENEQAKQFLSKAREYFKNNKDGLLYIEKLEK